MLNKLIERGLDSGMMNSSIEKLLSLTVYQKEIMILLKCHAGVTSGHFKNKRCIIEGEAFGDGGF